MAIKFIEDLKRALRAPNPKIVGGQSEIQPIFSFAGQPVVPSLAEPDFKRRPSTVADLKAILEHPAVDRNINALEQICFSGWNFKAVPPDDFDAKKNSDVIRQVTKALWEFNKIWRIETHLREAFSEVLGYRYSPYELAMGQVGKWLIPTYFEHLQAYSFGRSSSQFSSDIDANYVRDGLLKGIVYEGKERKPRLFQSQSGMAAEPVEIPSENVFMVMDPAVRIPDGASYLAGLVGTVLSHNDARAATNQVIARAGAPVAEYHVQKATEEELGYAEPTATTTGGDTDAGAAEYGWKWNYAVNLAKRQSRVNRVVVPGDIDIIWPDLKLALNPLEPDHYFIQEIIDHLVPVDVLKQMGTSLSKSSKELLVYIQLIMGGYRELIGMPFMDLMTYILNINGYEGWFVEPVWINLTPPDVAQDKTHSLETLKAGGITIRRYYKETGRDPLDEENKELEELYAEQALRFGKPMAPQIPGMQAMSASANIDSMEMLLDAKKGGMMKILDDYGYFDFKKKEKVKEKEKAES